MELRETISIDGKPFPKPLPRPAGELVELFRRHGYQFRDSKGTLILNEVYSPERWAVVQELAERESLDVAMKHSIWPVYGDEDYEKSPLWVLRFPDIWIDSIKFSTKCLECGRKTVKVDTSRRVPKVKSTASPVDTTGA